jgi:biopolymer transport protein ExbD
MPLKTTQDENLSLNLTPMIDVVFLLVIFFMVATKFTELERNIELELPQVASAGATAAPAEPKVVTVKADGETLLDGQSVTLNELSDLLAAAVSQSTEVQVVINGDARTPFQDIAATLAACREANVSELGITVEIAAASGRQVR